MKTDNMTPQELMGYLPAKWALKAIAQAEDVPVKCECGAPLDGDVCTGVVCHYCGGLHDENPCPNEVKDWYR